METKQIIERYGIYFDYIQKLDNLPLDAFPTIGSLGITRAHVQRAYKEMKVEKFKSSVVDYIACISLEYRIFQVVSKSGGKVTENLEKEFVEMLGKEYLLKAAGRDLVRFYNNPDIKKLKELWKANYPKSDLEYETWFAAALWYTVNLIGKENGL